MWALLQLHLHYPLNTWLGWIVQRHMQDEPRNKKFWRLVRLILDIWQYIKYDRPWSLQYGIWFRVVGRVILATHLPRGVVRVMNSPHCNVTWFRFILLNVWYSGDLSEYSFSHWETPLQCNIVLHWLSPYLEWSCLCWVAGICVTWICVLVNWIRCPIAWIDKSEEITVMESQVSIHGLNFKYIELVNVFIDASGSTNALTNVSDVKHCGASVWAITTVLIQLIQCALDISPSFFFQKLTRETPYLSPESKLWLKFYNCKCYALPFIEFYMTAIYQESIV